jgi:L-fuculose-phosphate aldolase
VPIAEYATPSTKELPEAVRQYVKAHDGMLLANHGALTIGADLFAAYYKMVTIEHFAKISLVARLLGGERLLSRQEVERLQGLRGMYGIASPAPICPDPFPPGDFAPPDAPTPSLAGTPGPAPLRRDAPAARRDASSTDPVTCQTVFAPQGAGVRLITEGRLRASRIGGDAEIRLTYRELTALIEAAVRELK